MTPRTSFSFAPDYAVAPGETLRERLAELNITQADLATRLGLSTKHVNQILQGVAPLTGETALALERVTGTPAGVWSRLEVAYREALLREAERALSKDDESWIASIPVKQLMATGELPKLTVASDIYQALLAFFGVADRAAWEGIWGRPVASFKRTSAFKSDPGSVASWLRIGQRTAASLEQGPYDSKKFKRALTTIRSLTVTADFQSLVTHCAEVGVSVIFVPEIGRTRISGAAWWASPTHAVIQLSDRYKKDDHFWFAFFHEAGHILLHSKKETFIDDGSEDDNIETEADRFASNTLIPASASVRLEQIKTTTQMKDFASEVGVAPGVVVGRLQHDLLWPWGKGNEYKRSIRIVSE